MLPSARFANASYASQDAITTDSAPGLPFLGRDGYIPPTVGASMLSAKRAIGCEIFRLHYNQSIVHFNREELPSRNRTSLEIHKTGLNNQSVVNRISPNTLIKSSAGLQRLEWPQRNAHSNNLREQAVAKVHRYTFQYSQNKKSDNRPFAEVEA